MKLIVGRCILTPKFQDSRFWGRLKAKSIFRWAVLRTTSPWRFDWPHSMQPKSHASKMRATFGGCHYGITKVDPCFDNCAIIWRDAVCHAIVWYCGMSMDYDELVYLEEGRVTIWVVVAESEGLQDDWKRIRESWVRMGAATFAGPNDEMKWTWNQAN